MRDDRRGRRAHELGRPEPRLRPARRRRRVQRPHGRWDRAHEGRPHLLARADRLPDSGERFPRPRRRPRGLLPRSHRRAADGPEHGPPTGPSGQTITAADCARRYPDDGSGRAAYEPGDPMQLPAAASARHARPVRTPHKPQGVYSSGFERGLDGWTVSNEGRYPGWPASTGDARSALPGGRSAGRPSAPTRASAVATRAPATSPA